MPDIITRALLESKGIPTRDIVAAIWGRKLSGGYEPAEATGTLPLTFRSNGTALIDYRIYGNTLTTKLNLWEWGNTNYRIDLTTPIAANTTLTYAVFKDGIADRAEGIYLYDANGSRILNAACANTNGSRIYATVTPTRDVHRIELSPMAADALRMLTEGDTPPDEYISPETTEVQGVGVRVDITGLSEPLCGIQTYTDSLDLSTGILTRRIKKLVLTGEERYIKDSSADYLYYIYVIHMLHTNCFCSHLMSTTGYPKQKEGCSTYNNASIVYLNFGANVMNTQPSGNTPTGLQEYLSAQYAAGTPVTLWYVLAEPDVSTIPIPSGLAGAIEGYLIQDDTPTPETPIYPTANGVKQGDGTYSIKYGYKLPMVSRTENLLSSDESFWHDGYYINAAGVPQSSYGAPEKETYSDHISVVPNQTLTFSYSNGFPSISSSPWRGIVFYDATGTFISRRAEYSQTPLIAVVPNNAAHCRVTFRTFGMPKLAMLTEGSTTPDSYIHYHRTETPIYIGGAQLMKDEYVSYGEQKIYREVGGTLTPTDPPVPLPELPTFSDADTVLDYEETPAPEEVWVKYQKGD